MVISCKYFQSFLVTVSSNLRTLLISDCTSDPTWLTPVSNLLWWLVLVMYKAVIGLTGIMLSCSPDQEPNLQSHLEGISFYHGGQRRCEHISTQESRTPHPPGVGIVHQLKIRVQWCKPRQAANPWWCPNPLESHSPSQQPGQSRRVRTGNWHASCLTAGDASIGPDGGGREKMRAGQG